MCKCERDLGGSGAILTSERYPVAAGILNIVDRRSTGTGSGEGLGITGSRTPAVLSAVDEDAIVGIVTTEQGEPLAPGIAPAGIAEHVKGNSVFDPADKTGEWENDADGASIGAAAGLSTRLSDC